MKYKHIIWDWNGTLLNDAEACTEAVAQMLAKRNLGTLTLEEYQSKIVFPVINLYYDAGFDMEKEDYQSICDEFTQNYANLSPSIQIHSDVREVLQKIKDKGLSQYIVSASELETLLRQVEHYGLKGFFVHILGQKDNQGESKNHLAQKLVTLTQCRPEEVLFIGDTLHDHEVAAEAGFDCCLVANGHCSRERLKATGAPVYENLTALYQAVFGTEDIKK